ncbi:glycosyltransferase involved in cell wall biosynthesis [Agromyces terreus]|uniref:Glycosyltransferase involved in cell wall biosynthesis n=1 Tax=Agromyces terreus TaxID=424795 RepID=A0A9X2GXW7_9MICO|nr:glycosyltransferase family 2 protein [Agromyces terreus]MCP2369451.1 glycosyltransferase involved in cell wall biosynthesis [Agromyces terreus]
MSPRVSIIVPVYNAAEFVTAALEHTATQTYQDVEIVIVDDGSRDDTAALAEAFTQREPRARLIRMGENGGVARARHRAIQESRGEYFWFIDADDGWNEHALEHLVAAADAGPCDVVVAGARIVYDGGAGSRPIAAPESPPVDNVDAMSMLLSGRITGHLWNKLFRRSLMQRIGLVPARVHSDLAMVADALSRARFVAFLDLEVYEYRLRSGSIITSGSRRAESLALVGDAVTEAARRASPALVDSDEHRYFVCRYIVLSGAKDAALAPYEPAEGRRLFESMRGRITNQDLLLLARRRDVQRLALATSARWSKPVYRGLLQVADRWFRVRGAGV